MALELCMLGLIVQDMDKSLQFYRQLGVDFPEESEHKTHIDVKMGNLTFFLDSKPKRWDPWFARQEDAGPSEAAQSYPAILEFFLETQTAVIAKYDELIRLGYQSYRAPYETSFKMYFAMVKDPDGNIVLLSGSFDSAKTLQEAQA
ncbi:MAG TPA: VOC family protein [Ktedonobacterales bacterium]|nr:VOC family protein [Ktedonobacterales bacterium]